MNVILILNHNCCIIHALLQAEIIILCPAGSGVSAQVNQAATGQNILHLLFVKLKLISADLLSILWQ
jgi:hypothetical protein